MAQKLRRVATRNLPLLAPLLGVLCVAFAQNGSLAYWNLPPERVDSLLLHVPADDHDRYERLRDEFAGLHCSTELMQHQPTGRQNGTNLICTLPGKSEAQIIIAARYDRNGESAGTGGRWSEALMLPLLYNALQAQPRLHTFVFAALNGEAGEKAFFDPLHKKPGQSATALVVLDKIGRGAPSIYTVKPAGFSKKSHALDESIKLLASEAITIAGMLQLANPGLSPPSPTGVGRASFNPDEKAVDDSMLIRAYQMPSILIYSSADSLTVFAGDRKHGQNHSQPTHSSTKDAPTASFHRNFDFVASFLCFIDIKLPHPGQ
jgi:hypothetical protein